MTEQERAQSFTDGVKALRLLYGFEYVAGVNTTEVDGVVMNTQGVIVLRPVKGWTSPPAGYAGELAHGNLD